MQPNGDNQQPTQQPAGPHPQPTQAAPVAPAAPQPAPAAAPAPQADKSITIKFEEDLQFTVTSDVFDDMRFMELYAEVSENELKVTKLVKFLIGDKNYQSIFDYYEKRGQKFTITKFGEVFEKLEKDLNAQPDFLSR